jgi:hypothetical protein
LFLFGKLGNRRVQLNALGGLTFLKDSLSGLTFLVDTEQRFRSYLIPLRLPPNRAPLSPAQTEKVFPVGVRYIGQFVSTAKFFRTFRSF